MESRDFKQGLRKKDDDRDENEGEKSVYTLTILEVVCVLGGLREHAAKILEAKETSKNEKPKMSRKSRRSLRGESSRKQRKSCLLKSMLVKRLYR